MPSLLWRPSTDAHICHDSRRLLDLCLSISTIVARLSISLRLVGVTDLISRLGFILLDVHRLGQGLSS